MSEPQASLHFDRPVLLLGGAPVALATLRRELARPLPLVAADGGANHLLGSDRVPDAIVGDLDSLAHRANWASRCPLLQVGEQDSTDFEKCLYSVEAPAYLALGFVGGRLDHTLACLHALAARVARQRVLLLGEEDVIGVCRGPQQLSLPPGSRLSVLPLTPVRFARSRGLQYPLDGLRLATGELVGASNCVRESTVCLEPEAGDQGVYALIAPLAAQPAFERSLLGQGCD